MSEEKTQGILLQSIPYLGRKRILKIFTPDLGLITLITSKLSLTSLSTPFCIGEWVYKKSQKEIHTLIDGTLLDSLFELKNEYAVLSAAGEMAQDLLRSQLPNREGKELYVLTCVYLKKLPSFKNPRVLAASFKMKLLLYEGIASLQEEFPFFSQPEKECLHLLTSARQFSQLQEIGWAPFEKIEQLFQERLSSQ